MMVLRRFLLLPLLLGASACTRFAIFEAGQASARDPRYTVVPQRERLAAARGEDRASAGESWVRDSAQHTGPPGEVRT